MRKYFSLEFDDDDDDDTALSFALTNIIFGVHKHSSTKLADNRACDLLAFQYELFLLTINLASSQPIIWSITIVNVC